MQKDVADVASFMRDKYDPLQQSVTVLGEEHKRLVDQVKEVLDMQREMNRAALLKDTGGRRMTLYRSVSGLSDHLCDDLDFEILSKFARRAFAVAEEKGDSDGMKRARAWRDNIVTHARAMDSTTAGAGDELVPTAERAQLWMDVHLRTAIAGLFARIPMPTNGFDIPLDLGNVNWYPGTANVAATSTDPTTGKRTLTAQELVSVVSWAYELDEDAVIAMLPTVRAKLVMNTAEVIDDVLLNADTTTGTTNINRDGSSIDTSTAGKAQYLLGWDGLLHIPLVDNTAQAVNHNAAPSDDLFNEVRSKMDKYGVRPGEMATIVDINLYIRAQSISNFRTLDKLGPNATLLTGQLGDIEGIPVIVSEQMLLADTDGRVTGAGNATDTSRLLIVNRGQYYVGFKRDLMIEVDRDVQKRQTVMVASFRIAFEGRNTNASDTAVALGYDITGTS